MPAAVQGLAAEVVERFTDPRWRLNNLYWITDKQGARIPFRLNWAQEELLADLHFLNLILKARQLGFTTFIQIYMLDACVFHNDTRAGVIAHTKDDAEAIFRDKIKFPYDNLPDGIKEKSPVRRDNTTTLELGNNSIIRVGTSMRGGTLQYLHVSEFGKVCAKFPSKAREIVTGALNTIESGQVAWIESTAEGQEGRFYEMCQEAQSKARTGARLTPMDWKFHFFPWWREPAYALPAEGVAIPEPVSRYMDELKDQHGIETTPDQRAWYAKKYETQQEDMKREFPSTPDEAFEASVEGAYYASQMAKAETEGRIGAHKYKAALPVHTAWDIGRGEYTAIWFFQLIGQKIGLVGYYQNCGEGAPHYLKELHKRAVERDWKYGDHWLPHDVKVTEWGTDRSRVESLIAGTDVGGGVVFGIKPRLTPQLSLDDGIEAVRATLGRCWFDEEECADGLRALRNYRKEWDEERGVWKDIPRHDDASHGADAFRYLSVAWRELVPAPPPPKSKILSVGPSNQVTLNDLWKEADRRTKDYKRV